MVSLYHKDERVKIGIFIVILLIIEALIFTTLFIKIVNNINKNIIKQNYSIIGTVTLKDSNFAKDIIPIITDGEIRNNDIGQKILSNYSYDYAMDYKYNPLVVNEGNNLINYIIIISLIIVTIMIVGVFILLNPLYKKFKYLTFRAENIVENKFLEMNNNNYSGSLDKFTLKFYQMEDRIKNSIELLQAEKVNLKNIIDDISHQLKTPLMALQMYNEILKDYKTMEDDDIENFISLSNEQLGRMEWLVKTLLKYARLESNVVEYHKEDISLNNTIEESLSALIIKAKEKEQQLIFKESKEIVFYHDRKWIVEALSNIIKNAIEHTAEKGRIEIILEETPISINITISDNGEGIEKDKLKKIFERFYKGENSINPTSIGIGLSLSSAIVKAHNGNITVESEVGVGSTFYINFIKTII